MKILTTAVALLIAGATYAHVKTTNPISPKKKVAIVQHVEAKFKLVYLDKNKGEVKINITDDDGNSVHQQVVGNEGGFSQQFDFNSLPEGKYTFEITQPNGIKLSEVVKFAKNSGKDTNRLRADLLNINDDKKFRLAVLHNEKPVKVKIYNASDELLHTETITQLSGFRKVYDIENSADNEFRFEISSDNNTVSLFSK